MKVTVAVPTFNRADFLQQMLAGVVAQQFPRDHFEILVIDNNSRDHTAAVVAGFAQAHPAPRLVVEPHQGLNHARNRAIAEAAGEIIIFADDDILVQPDWIAQLTVPLLADSTRRIGAVGGEVIPVFPDGLPGWMTHSHARLGFRRDTGPLPPSDSPMGANLGIPKWVFAEIGGFRTALDRRADKFFSGGETEVLRRIRAAGWEVWFSAAAAVRHQMPASRTTFRYAARQAFDSARSRVIDRAAQPGARRFLAGRFAACLVSAGAHAVLGVLNAMVFRGGEAKRALIRSWRSCGYLYQIPRSLRGRV